MIRPRLDGFRFSSVLSRASLPHGASSAVATVPLTLPRPLRGVQRRRQRDNRRLVASRSGDPGSREINAANC